MTDTLIQSWQQVFREGFVRVLPKKGLQALYKALQDDDSRLIQGTTTRPFAAQSSVKCCCVVSYALWANHKYDMTVRALLHDFTDACFAVNELCRGKNGNSCQLLTFWDEVDRTTGRKLLMEELELAASFGYFTLPS